MLRSLLIILVCAFTISTFAQTAFKFSSGKLELGLSGSLGSIKTESEIKSSYSNSSFISKNSDTKNYFQLSLMPSIFIIYGLSIESEIDLFILEKSKPAFSLIGNVNYTFDIGQPQVAPFVKAGYGLSNSVKLPINSGIANRVSDTFDIPIINFGAGAKIFISQSVLFKSEINYRILSYSYTNTYKSGNYSNTTSGQYDYSFLTMLFGFSVLL